MAGEKKPDNDDDIVQPRSKFQERYLKSNAKILVVGGAAKLSGGVKPLELRES